VAIGDPEPTSTVRRVKTSTVLREARRALAASPLIEHYAGHASIESRELLAEALGHSAPVPQEMAAAEVRRFESLLSRRLEGETVAVIRGWEGFRGLRIGVRPGVFIPRQSSELLAEQAVRRLRARQQPIAVDVATGAGPVALSIANEVPRATVFGTDIAIDAIGLARANARRLKLQVRFVVADGLAGLPASIRRSVDVITMHPPYVPMDEVADLPDEFRRIEPLHTHSDGSDDGMRLVRETASRAAGWLKTGGWLAVEVSPDLSRKVAAILRAENFRDVTITGPRHWGTRVILGRR
jgi:release factor glutamine methyltransferase